MYNNQSVLQALAMATAFSLGSGYSRGVKPIPRPVKKTDPIKKAARKRAKVARRKNRDSR